MASEQTTRRKENTESLVEKDRVPKMTIHFENLAEEANKGSPDRGVDKEKSHQFVSLADKPSHDRRREKGRDRKEGEFAAGEAESAYKRSSRDQIDLGKFEVGEAEAKDDKDRKIPKEEEVPSLEEISGLRAQAQEKSTAAIRAAEERYTAALNSAKQGLSSTAEKGSEVKDSCMIRARDVAEKGKEGGAVVAHYVGAAASGAKDRAAAAGWTAAHFSVETAVDGTVAAAKAVKGAAEKAAEIAVKPLSAAKEAALSAGESAKDYTAWKKEEAHRGLEAKQKQQETGSHGVEKKEEFSPTEEEDTEQLSSQYDYDQGSRSKGQCGSPTVLGAIGETIVEIAQTTKDLVIGEDQTKGQGYEKRITSRDQS